MWFELPEMLLLIYYLNEVKRNGTYSKGWIAEEGGATLPEAYQ